MKKLFIPLLVLLACAMLLIGCSNAATPTEGTTTKPAVSTTPPAATQPSATAGSPVYGGTLRIIGDVGPRELSYFPEFGPGEETAILPAAEKLCEFVAAGGSPPPFLAESYEVGKDSAGLDTLTFKIKRGIKFHDGSELTAQVVAWNYQIAKDSGRMQYSPLLQSIEVVDDYTLTLHMTNWNILMINSFGWVPIFSQAAWDKAGGGDLAKAKQWAYQNIVATGPFKLGNFTPDVSISWVKNTDYWQQGKPYLDGIDVRFIPNQVTASQMMQAGEADIWATADLQNQADMVAKGFIRQSSQGLGLSQVIIPNNTDPNSKWHNKKLREALEYALDKTAISKALSFGFGEPLNGVAPKGMWGYIENETRPYDPAKAKALLAEAGYPNGLKVTMLCLAGSGGRNTLAEAVKGYLDAAGFETTLDVADGGRFNTSAWKNGWDDLLLQWIGTGKPNYLNAFQRQLGKYPMARLASFQAPERLAALSEESLTKTTEAEMKDITLKLTTEIEDEALVIPLYFSPAAYIIKPYVHTTYLQQGMVTREFYDEWMDKH